MKKIIVLNHKSQMKYNEVKTYPIEINDYIRKDQTTIICPSSIYMPYFNGKYNFDLGSQNISSTNITGELTGELLKSVGVKYSLIGSKDRKEESKEINEKIKSALNNNINPIIVIGETYYEKQLNKTAQIIMKQITSYLKDIKVQQDIIICYTPNWSYEGKQIPTTNYIYEAVELIKSIIKRKYNANIKVIYGGNITINNIEELDKLSNLDGFLIEKSSTDIKEIKKIINKVE